MSCRCDSGEAVTTDVSLRIEALRLAVKLAEGEMLTDPSVVIASATMFNDFLSASPGKGSRQTNGASG